MRRGVLIFVCLIIVLPSNIACFDFIRDLLIPRTTFINKVRRIEDARALGDDYAVLDTVGLVERYGYQIDEHKVTTVDGYNLKFFRISGSPLSPGRKGKPVIFMQHGIFGTSDMWVLMGPGKDLAFLLADAGYDVWIGNIRGNSYCRSHDYLSPSNPDFWNFSFHESAIRDLPKMIDYALDLTDQKTLLYIGHSMGTTMAYVMLSEMPDYNDRIRLVLSLAPVAYWNQSPRLLIRLIGENIPLIKSLFEKNGIYDVVPQTRTSVKLSRALCKDGSLTQALCRAWLFAFSGDSPEQFNSTLLPYIYSHFPAGASTTTVYHFRQNIEARNFQQYDLGYKENYRIYGKRKPPIYNVKKISAPVALFYAKNDYLSLEPNVLELAERLENVVTLETVPLSSFSHLDFLWATDAKKLLYDRVIELVNMYSQ